MLLGGDEFGPRSQPLNQAILRLTGKDSPRVVILPVAAENPGKVARTGINTLNMLGASAEWTLAGAKSVSDQSSVPLTGIETAHAIYLPDGGPLDATTALANTEALAKVRRAWASGTILAASAAGAMALCDHYWDGGLWEPGLGLLKGIVVLPHHEMVIGRFSTDRLRQGLPEGYEILGLDDVMGVIVEQAGQECSVLGPDFVTVYRADSVEEYNDGGHFKLAVPVG